MKLKKGDIFNIKISSTNFAMGQIINLSKDGLTIIVFEGLYPSSIIPNFTELVNENILLFANTFDAKFYHKHWEIIGNYILNLNDIKLPVYKLGTDEDLRYEDFFMKPISDKTLFLNCKEKIGYRNFVAPVRIENAIKAYYKLIDWNDDYEKLLYENLITI